MNKKQRGLVADHIERQAESLIDAILASSAGSKQSELLPIAKAWLENQIKLCRETTCNAREWASGAAKQLDTLGMGPGDAILLLRKFRDALIKACTGKIEGMEDALILTLITQNADELLQSMMDHLAQQMQDCRAAERRRQQVIVETVNRPMALLDEQGHIELANREFGRFLNSAPDALQGSDAPRLFDDATAEQIRAALQTTAAKPQSKTFTASVIQGKKAVEVRLIVQILLDMAGRTAGAIICLDPEPMADTAADIHLIEDRILKNLPFPIQIIDGAGNLVSSSEEVKLIAPQGYEGREALCCYLYRQRQEGNRKCPCEDVFRTGQFHIEEFCHSAAGETRWYLLLMLPVPDAAGKVQHIISCTYDLTRRKQIHKQLENQIITQQRSSLVAQIAVTVAHQLRNPLSVVLGFAEMMAKGLPPEQHYEAVTRILRNSIRCKDIVENLLDFGKGMPLERRPMDLSLLLSESIRPMLTPAQNRLIEWRLSEEPAMVECVPEQLTQVVLSILDNALCVAVSHIVCTVEIKSETVRLRITDDGPGIPLELRDRVFEPFFTTRRESGAVGLGLSLARAVANDYGGNLTVGSPIGDDPNGACLVLQLPKYVSATGSKEKGEDAAAGDSNAAAAKHILIVDDEADLLDLLKTTLYMRGFVVDALSSGPEAIQKLQENSYNAIVIDYQLSGTVNGRDVYEQIRQFYPHLVDHVMFITADTMNYQTRTYLESIKRPVLEKPFLMADFVALLNKLS